MGLRYRGAMDRPMVALSLAAALVAGACATRADEASAWSVLPPVPEERTEVTAAQIDGDVYVIGGYAPDPAGTALGSRRVDVFDRDAGTWSRSPDLPIGLHHSAAVALGSRLIVVGGYTTGGFVPTPTTWVLDTAAAQPAWAPFVPLPEPRGAHVAVTDGERIWVAGGVGPTGLLGAAYVLEDGAPMWTPVAPMPGPREHLAGAYLDGVVYIAGGRLGSLESNTARADAFDVATGTWSRLPDLPTARGGIAGAASDGRVFVFGGEANSGTFDEAEAYDPVTGAWEELDPMPTARHGLGAAVIGDAIHVLAGGEQPGLFFSGAHEVLAA